ncbi:MAG: hypothetical protein K1X55_05220 [Chitinophagales bacterium]|nr:hypothetical protein [Chitinophagales bacterium]
MTKQSIKISGTLLTSEVKNSNTIDLELRVYPWFEEGSQVLSNGIVFKSFPIKLISNELVAEVDNIVYPKTVFTVYAKQTIQSVVKVTAFDMMARTNQVNTNNGNFVPGEVWCMPLEYEIKIADLQSFLSYAYVDNIWFGAIPFKDGLYVEDGVIKIDMQLTGFIGSFSGKATFSLKITPASSANNNRYVNVELVDTKGIGLDKKIVENAFSKDLIPFLEKAIDDFLADTAKKELDPLDQVVETLTNNRARTKSRGLMLNQILPEKDAIQLTFAVAYAVAVS